MPRNLRRRAVLAGISTLPAALAAATLSAPAMAAPAASAEAALIAQAALVTRLSRLSDRAADRASRKSDAVMLARGPKPTAPDPWGGATIIDEHPVDPASDIERRFTVTMRKPPAGHKEAKRRHEEAMEAWGANIDRLARKAGTLCDTLFDRLQDATDALAATIAASPAGVAAKAGAFLALMETRDSAEEWEMDLARSLARDTIRIGSAA